MLYDGFYDVEVHSQSVEGSDRVMGNITDQLPLGLMSSLCDISSSLWDILDLILTSQPFNNIGLWLDYKQQHTTWDMANRRLSQERKI